LAKKIVPKKFMLMLLNQS